MGLLRENEIQNDDENIFNRTMVVVHAARERGMAIHSLNCFGKLTNFFSIKLETHKRFLFEALPLAPIGRAWRINFDDKFVFKKFLEEHGFPYAQGAVFYTERVAVRFAATVGYPLVVKPQCGSLSQHIICNIKTEDELRRAVHIVQMVGSEFIVERYIPGDVYRVTVVGQKFACCLREKPNVVGNGKHTIEELVQKKNAMSGRGEAGHKNFTLHKIHFNTHADDVLRIQGATRTSILPAGQKVYFHDKLILAAGADIHDKTDIMHLENRELFVRLAKMLAAPVVGFDLICSDITRPLVSQSCAIIEANSLPYIDMHHYPVSGQSRNVAGWILDEWENKYHSVFSVKK